MKIYRNVNGSLYMVEHLIHDIKHLNRNANAGIYAIPYLHNSQPIKFLSQDKNLCREFVDKNFKIVSEK